MFLRVISITLYSLLNQTGLKKQQKHKKSNNSLRKYGNDNNCEWNGVFLKLS